MSKYRIWILVRRIIFVPLLLGMIATSSLARAQEVIVNQSVPSNSITTSNLRAIFSMRLRQWPNGVPIKVFVLSGDDPLHVSFSKSVLQTFPYQLKRSWDILVYSGTGQGPTVVESAREMLRLVSQTPGAIGYISDDYLKGGETSEHIAILHVR